VSSGLHGRRNILQGRRRTLAEREQTRKKRGARARFLEDDIRSHCDLISRAARMKWLIVDLKRAPEDLFAGDRSSSENKRDGSKIRRRLVEPLHSRRSRLIPARSAIGERRIRVGSSLDRDCRTGEAFAG